MDIDKMTIGEAKAIAAMFGGGNQAKQEHPASGYVGDHVLVRSGQSGVWYGNLDAVHGSGSNTTVRLGSARRVWYWDGASSCSQLATDGPKDGSKIAAKVESCVITGVCEIIPTTQAAFDALGEVAAWVQ